MRDVIGFFQLKRHLPHIRLLGLGYLHQLICMLFTFATIPAFAQSVLPALSIRLGSGAAATLTVSTVLVSPDQEPEFLRKLR
jgi:hypothetical protein